MTAKQLTRTLPTYGVGRLHELETGHDKTSHLKASYRKAKHRRGREMILLRQNLYFCDLKAAAGATR